MKSIRLLPGITFLFLFAIIIAATSCKKAPYELGLSLLPPTDTVSVKSSNATTIFAVSEIQNSIRTDKATTNMLGSIVDPVFGKTTASFCTQFQLPGDSTNFGTNPVLDSIVLTLRYNSVYGDAKTLQNIKVYELSEDISPDSSYYSNRNISHYQTLIAEKTFSPDITDSLTVYGTKVAPHLRINLNKLSNYFGNKLLYAPSNSTNFVKFMKGLYIESSPVAAGGSLISFNMGSSLSSLTLFYKNPERPTDSLYTFIITSTCARINKFDHDYREASPEFLKDVDISGKHPEKSDGTNRLYLQGLGGVKVKIQLKDICKYAYKLDSVKQLDGTFKKDTIRFHIAINNASLVLKNVETDNTLAPPAQLTLMKVDSTSLIDENEGTAYFGGTYHASDKSYAFRITRHIQKIINAFVDKKENINYDLYLLVNNPSSNVLYPNRLRGIGTSPSLAGRLQLQLVYTKLQ